MSDIQRSNATSVFRGVEMGHRQLARRLLHILRSPDPKDPADSTRAVAVMCRVLSQVRRRSSDLSSVFDNFTHGDDDDCDSDVPDFHGELPGESSWTPINHPGSTG